MVLMDVATGQLLVYASHVDKGPARDLCAEATAPSARASSRSSPPRPWSRTRTSGPTRRQCYSGGESAHQRGRPRRRSRSATAGARRSPGAMGRSINTVFARLASEHLAPPQLEAMARRFGYGEAAAFDVPVQPSALHMPSEPLEFARTAAGFWNTTLSPHPGRRDERHRRARAARRSGRASSTTVVSSAGAGALVGPRRPASPRRGVARDRRRPGRR